MTILPRPTFDEWSFLYVNEILFFISLLLFPLDISFLICFVLMKELRDKVK